MIWTFSRLEKEADYTYSITVGKRTKEKENLKLFLLKEEDNKYYSDN